MPSVHRLGLGLPGYLIPFAPPAFVFQCQDRSNSNLPKADQNRSAPLTRNILESRLRHRHSSRYPHILPLHREFHSPLVSSIQIVSDAIQRLSRWISHLTHQDTYTPFTPSDSEQRLPPPYYRGCWHEVGRGFLRRYRLTSECIRSGGLRPSRQDFTITRIFIVHAALLRQGFPHCEKFPTAATRRCLDRVSVPVWLAVLSDQLPIVALVGRYPTN